MIGLVRDLNPGPLAPKARIIPLDQRATAVSHLGNGCIDKIIAKYRTTCAMCTSWFRQS